MPALIITAVNPATDTLTSVAHGLLTGDGPIAAFTPNGTLPGGLAPLTNVWAIRTGADTFKLASSSANAGIGTAIDITSAGSGTIYLLVGIPYRRARDFAPGAQVKSADLNAMQDALVDLWNLLSGQAQSIFFSMGFRKHPEIPYPIHASGFVNIGANVPVWSPGGAGAFWGPGAGGSVWMATGRIPTGDRVTRARFAYRRSSGAGDTTIAIGKMTSAGVSTTLATFTDNVHDGTDQVHELAGINYTMAADEYLQLNISIGDNTGPGRVYGATPFADNL